MGQPTGTVKRAEEDDGIVVRFYEFKQYRNEKVNVHFAFPIKKAVEVNLVEEEVGVAAYDRRTLSFAIAPYEIKTFKLWF